MLQCSLHLEKVKVKGFCATALTVVESLMFALLAVSGDRFSHPKDIDNLLIIINLIEF